MLSDIEILAIGDHFIDRCGCIYRVTGAMENEPNRRRPVAAVEVSCGSHLQGYLVSFGPDVLVEVDPLRLALALECR